MKKLSHVFLSHNFLEGELPSELAELSKLRDLYLEHNAFKGTISTEFARLQRLGEDVVNRGLCLIVLEKLMMIVELSFTENFRIFETQVTGTMPTAVCNLIDKENLKTLEADCRVGRITCPCCTKCY
jgi:hypothetical protein